MVSQGNDFCVVMVFAFYFVQLDYLPGKVVPDGLVSVLVKQKRNKQM